MSYLMHYGVKGQKWGIRRYQNEDGTLTEEGKRKFGHIQDTHERNLAIAKSASRRDKGQAWADSWLSYAKATPGYGIVDGVKNRKSFGRILKDSNKNYKDYWGNQKTFWKAGSKSYTEKLLKQLESEQVASIK